ncbi:xanthine dehydrogenase family protein subunit M [Pseudorhodoferax sp. Leaf265]|jgi:carbon-monoxide dehydrogenase medium subunit|uniref:FAD binding domain-containing protein n=1 Tax=Pseudorhodoferax sp. Leaf265 TaxID=1736315 RepID=UPI0006FEA5D3|nr:FAD binding domain-containing protein [Pseudorhodoferax sp. Leaf265]KQP15967.1 carbon monoxide dehydrogenase [Pseudorhodoferax sp. Leaf265]
MKAAAYTLERPTALAALNARLADGGWGVKPIAGGQSLGAMLNLRLAQPETLLDLDTLDELRAVHETPEAVRFGAMVTHAQIEDGKVPDPTRGLMPCVARGIAYRAVRNRGTLGGSLCHADPAADWVSTMPLLGATCLLAGPDGAREVPAADFVVSAFETALGEGELLTAVQVPRRSNATRWAYRKFCRKTGEFANALAACLLDPADGTERVVLGALDGAPRVVEESGLFARLASGAERARWLEEQALGLDDARQSMLAEMLRLALRDLETAR